MSKIKTVEILQISAGLAAALRWAIALMPLDGLPFALSSRPWFEPISFILSLTFAAVEIGATAYIMRAWRMEPDKRTQRGLMWLWVVALVLMVASQVPPILANINGVAVTMYPFWFQSLWAVCGVAVTFVVIGGVGYAEKSLVNAPHDGHELISDEGDDCYCPICNDMIGLPVWLLDKYGNKYIAYCNKCKRAYTENEVVWKKADYKPAILTPNDADQSPHAEPQAALDHAPSRDLTDFDVLKLWRAHGQADAWQQVSDIVSECLNGNTPNLKAWYDGKRSIAGLTTALGMDAAQAKRTGALVRGLIKPSEDQKVIDTDSK